MKTEIKAEEVRIGISAIVGGVEIGVSYTVMQRWLAGAIKLYAIPLTEDWLVNKFGFNREDIGGVSAQFNIGENPVTRDYMMQLVWLKSLKDYSLEDAPFFKNGFHKIQYVHQLQNLYYALTQTELTK